MYSTLYLPYILLTCRHTLWSSLHGHSDHMGNKRTEIDKLREGIGPCILNDRSHFVVVRAFALQSEGRWFDTAAATQKTALKWHLLCPRYSLNMKRIHPGQVCPVSGLNRMCGVRLSLYCGKKQHF